MLENECQTLDAFFKRHSAAVNIEYSFEQHTTASHMLSSQVDMDVTFSSASRFSRFAREIAKLDDLHYEEYLRMKHPSLARAYEEYQILLKLLK